LTISWNGKIPSKKGANPCIFIQTTIINTNILILEFIWWIETSVNHGIVLSGGIEILSGGTTVNEGPRAEGR
jgi:hypothetical protein